jgi:hypothetical protein
MFYLYFCIRNKTQFQYDLIIFSVRNQVVEFFKKKCSCSSWLGIDQDEVLSASWSIDSNLKNQVNIVILIIPLTQVVSSNSNSTQVPSQTVMQRSSLLSPTLAYAA